MNQIIRDLLEGKKQDYIFPFFWQHGEDEATLRLLMKAIHESGCNSVCIESRPHPDFCGEKWWKDMDIILEEARKREMKVWILDDSHFPTGFANGAVKSAPLSLHRQSVVSACRKYKGKEKDVEINLTELFPPKLRLDYKSRAVMTFVAGKTAKFDDDRILAVTVMDAKGNTTPLEIGNTGKILWHKPEGECRVYVVGLSRNYGIHREYINMMSKESCRILIDTVYEPHFAHYKDDFGKTIAGFFSDEPELGNGVYVTGANRMGDEIDFPYSPELEEELKKRLGESWKEDLLYLWENDFPKKAAKVRLEYMDAVTKLVRKDFSEQLGLWCAEHGVKYIGHVIEDNNSHSRTGMSLGHYFRGLNGQDMAGIDDIGGQVLPQGEDLKIKTFFGERDGEFYHFALGNLAASFAAIDPKKHGDAMCEIFGNYGWSEGVRLEKYLAEHFMVRGVNHFVPHAFTGKAFPDPDCPPHFYAFGHNPQYRHFGKIVNYMNRVCSLISNGKRESRVAVLYNAETEWMADSMLVQKPLRKLYEAQILADTIPFDALKEKERYHTESGKTLKVNKQEYEVLIVPYARYITGEMNALLKELSIPVWFIDALPQILEDGSTPVYETVTLGDLANKVRNIIGGITISPANRNIRILEYTHETPLLYLFSEAAETYCGKLSVDLSDWYEYDAWNNRIYALTGSEITLEPNKGKLLIKDTSEKEWLSERILPLGEKQTLTRFERSVSEAVNYPDFKEKKEVSLPDNYVKENKKFAGVIRYETEIELTEEEKAVLEITDAYEGVEVFLNGTSLGIQVVPAFLYDLTTAQKTGKNTLAIEVATNLGRAMDGGLMQKMRNKATGSYVAKDELQGITGEVNLYLSPREK